MTYALDNKDRYGYYTVGNRKTYSKLEAIDFSHLSGNKIEWHYNRAVYGAYNWEQEPTATLDELYEARARQLRNQYDYLVLWYSGGADSHNILMAFVRAGIYIDEIAQYHQLEAHGGNKQSWTNQEVFETSIPITQQLIESNPIYATTKHRLVDMTEYQTGLMLENENRWDYFYKINRYYSTNCLSRYQVRERIADYKNIIDSGKRLCFIYGIEKPVVTKDNKGYWIHFLDGQDHGVSAWAQTNNRAGDYDEFFYWAPDMPELPAKQAHVLRQYLELVTPAQCDGIHLKQEKFYIDEYGSQRIDYNQTYPIVQFNLRNQDYHLTARGAHRLLYPDWNPDAVVCGKPHGHMFPPRDSWLLHPSAPDLGQRYYTQGLPWLRQHVKAIDPSLWVEYRFDPKIAPYIGFVRDFKNSYYIGPANDSTV